MTDHHEDGHTGNHEIQKDPVVGDDAKAGAKELDGIAPPEEGTHEARNHHDHAGKDETLGGTVDIAEVKNSGVVLLPGGQEEGEGGEEQEEGRVIGVTHRHAGGLVDGANTAVQGVASVIKQLSQGRRGSSTTSLLSIDIVKSRVQPQSNGTAIVVEEWGRVR